MTLGIKLAGWWGLGSYFGQYCILIMLIVSFEHIKIIQIQGFVNIPQYGDGIASLHVTIAASIVLHHFGGIISLNLKGNDSILPFK